MADIANDKKDTRSKLLTAAVIIILCVIFVVGFIYGLNSVLAMEGAFPPSELAAGLTELPDTVRSSEDEVAAFTGADMIKYLTSLTDAALTNEASVSAGRGFDIDNDTLTSTGSEKFTDAMKFIADGTDSGNTLGDMLRSDFTGGATTFGEDMSGVLRLPELTENDIESFDISYIYYACPICGATGDEKKDGCEACGSTYPYNVMYRNDYSITLRLVNNEDVLARNFAPRTDEQITALIADGMDGNFSLTAFDREYKELLISFTVDRATDHIKNLSFIKRLGINASADFEGDWAVLGGVNASFELTQNDSFSFTWPGIELDEHKIYIEPKGTDNLIAALTCAEPTKMTVSWSSSDPDTVSVDDEGYLKACKTDGGKAVITASYEFNGRTYTDSCEVTVKYPVESTSLKKNKVTLAPGEEFALTVKFDPKKSTVQTVKWYTEDESIATVDENGIVKAVSAGETTVYSLSDDGYFRSSCKVTVK